MLTCILTREAIEKEICYFDIVPPSGMTLPSVKKSKRREKKLTFLNILRLLTYKDRIQARKTEN